MLHFGQGGITIINLLKGLAFLPAVPFLRLRILSQIKELTGQDGGSHSALGKIGEFLVVFGYIYLGQIIKDLTHDLTMYHIFWKHDPKRKESQYSHQPTIKEYLFSAALRLGGSFLTYPLVFMTNLSLVQSNTSTFEVIQEVMKRKGILGLYTGFWPYILYDGFKEFLKLPALTLNIGLDCTYRGSFWGSTTPLKQTIFVSLLSFYTPFPYIGLGRCFAHRCNLLSKHYFLPLHDFADLL